MAAMMPAGQNLNCCCLVGFVNTIKRPYGVFKISQGGLVILRTSCDSQSGYHTIKGPAVVSTQM